MLNLLILAAGRSSGLSDDYPLCLKEFNGIPLIQRIIEACDCVKADKITVALRASDIRLHHLDDVVSLLIPGTDILTIRNDTRGAACTALMAIASINSNSELLIVNGNDLLEFPLNEFISNLRSRDLDAGAVVFSSVHPRYSYLRLAADGAVVEAAEKRPISRNATTGHYWYARGSEFVEACMAMIKKDANVGGDFYIAPAFNEFVLNHKKVGVFPVDSKLYHPLKTDQQIAQFESRLS